MAPFSPFSDDDGFERRFHLGLRHCQHEYAEMVTAVFDSLPLSDLARWFNFASARLTSASDLSGPALREASGTNSTDGGWVFSPWGLHVAGEPGFTRSGRIVALVLRQMPDEVWEQLARCFRAAAP